MELIFTANDAVLNLQPGDQLVLVLPEDLSAEQLKTLSDNLTMGSLVNHITVRVGKDGMIEFVTNYDCDCFGADLKKGVVAIAFDAPGSKAEKIALGEAIRTARFPSLFTTVLAITPSAPVDVPPVVQPVVPPKN